MIRKKDLRGKYVEYLDNDGKNRIGRVVKIVGSWLTVKNVLGRRRRVHKDRVLCRMRPKLGKEEIEWQ
jgi:hypothetical protein